MTIFLQLAQWSNLKFVFNQVITMTRLECEYIYKSSWFIFLSPTVPGEIAFLNDTIMCFILTWNIHIDKISKTISRATSLLYKILTFCK